WSANKKSAFSAFIRVPFSWSYNMSQPDFTKIAYKAPGKSVGDTAVSPTPTWQTLEQIEVRPFYTQSDLQNMEHLNFVAGIPPYLRGPYPAMYAVQPWTVRQYAGYSTAE